MSSATPQELTAAAVIQRLEAGEYPRDVVITLARGFLPLPQEDLIAVLAANPERVLTRAQLRDKVWGYPHDLDDHSVDPHVQRLRRKLSRHPESGVVLDAVPGLGYRLAVRSV